MEEPEEPREIEVEVEVEEMQQREVERDVVEEKLVPRVRAVFKYQGQGMGFEKGEVRHTQFAVAIMIYLRQKYTA